MAASDPQQPLASIHSDWLQTAKTGRSIALNFRVSRKVIEGEEFV
jgi:hypothetical protein